MKRLQTTIEDSLRISLRGMASSVAIVSTELDGTRYGMVATAVMSVTLEPPSIAVAINRSASIHTPLLERGAFVINLLSKENEDIANGFMASKGESRFAFGPWAAHESSEADLNRLPYLANAQAAISCRLTDSIRKGTHTLVIGEVIDVIQAETFSPLLYCNGTYCSLA
ncbi:MAG: flavin reductase family protein [Aquisalimonadaceae bacterium]